MKIKILTITLITVSWLQAQSNHSKFDYRLGTGIALLGPNKLSGICIENEFNYKFSQYFSTSASLNYGRSTKDDIYNNASIMQGNLNIFISPFKNNKKNDFRLGTGWGYNNRYYVYSEAPVNVNGQLVSYYYPEIQKSVGLNIIIENTYSISDKFLIGVKLFSQPYFTGDINSGVLLKLGVKI